MPQITMNGAKIAYRDAGTGQTLVLLHSSACSGAQWQRLVEALQSDFRLLAPDLYGYGESDAWPGPRPLSLSDEAAAVAAVAVDCPAPLHLVGHSYGGAVALRFALERPERIRSLTLIEPVAFHLLKQGGFDDMALFDEITDLATAVSVAGSSDPAIGMFRFIDYWNGAGAWDRMPRERQAALATYAFAVAANFRATMAEVTPLQAYQRIRVPTLILCGATSPRPTRRIAAILASALPLARMKSVAGAGHMLPLTHADLVRGIVVEHLSSRIGRRAAA